MLPNVLDENTTETNPNLILLIFIVFVILYLVIVGESFNVKSNRAKLIKQYIDYYSQSEAVKEMKVYQEDFKDYQMSVIKELESISHDVSKINKTIELLSKNKKYQSSHSSIIKSLFILILKR